MTTNRAATSFGKRYASAVAGDTASGRATAAAITNHRATRGAATIGVASREGVRPNADSLVRRSSTADCDNGRIGLSGVTGR